MVSVSQLVSQPAVSESAPEVCGSAIRELESTLITLGYNPVSLLLC